VPRFTLQRVAVPALSLVIVTHDSREDIGACLAAVKRQVFPPGFEAIVVDNGSRDGTADLVRAEFPWAQVVEQPNLGFGAGNNRGAREARGEVLAFLNPDTVPEPGFLAALHAAVHAGQAATAQLVLKSDPQRINTVGHRLHFTGFGFVVGFRQPRLPPGPPIPAQGISGAAFALLRSDYWRVGGFDEDFFLYMEDTELSWRLQRSGFRIVVAPGAVATHDYALRLPPEKIGHLETGRLLLLRKHLPGRLWVAYAPSLLLAELLSWVRAAGLGPRGLRAKARALRSGMRRGIHHPALPRARPHRFASRSLPFGDLSPSAGVRVLGGVANLLFRLNTLAWPLRRKPPQE
jgi:GT2 family glycosyltransferase